MDHGCSIWAAAISYYTLLTSVPLVLSAIAGLGFAVGSSDRAYFGILDAIGRIAPGSRDTIADVLATLIRQRRGVGLIALASLFWTGSAVFGVMERAMDTAWHVEQRRGMVVSRLRGAVLVIISGMGLLASTFLASLMTLGHERLGTLGLRPLAKLAGLWHVFPLVVQLALSTFALTLLISVVPNRRVPFRAALRGGLATMALWELSKHLFAQYLRHFAPYSGTYGPIGGVVILVVWVYYSAAIVLLGAEATALLVRDREAREARLVAAQQGLTALRAPAEAM